jgi:hypothetical protein
MLCQRELGELLFQLHAAQLPYESAISRALGEKQFAKIVFGRKGLSTALEVALKSIPDMLFITHEG